MQTRLAVRRSVQRFLGEIAAQNTAEKRELPLVLVGLSGGADSLALAAALAAEAHSLAVRAGAIVVDHGLQPGSAQVAERAAEQARALGLSPVGVLAAAIDAGDAGGPEAVARAGRYDVFVAFTAETHAVAVLTAHTRDDQAEQVLLALARGSGSRSIAGIPPVRPLGAQSSGTQTFLLRPFLEESLDITRQTTEQACEELGLEYWCDPHNTDRSYARVRVREDLMPAIERELGGGVRAGLARSADLAREDAAALDAWAQQVVERTVTTEPAGVSVPVSELAAVPAAVRQRVIHRVARTEFAASLSRDHTLTIAALVTHWHGQGPIFVPGVRVSRADGKLLFEQQLNSPRKQRK